MLRGTGVGKSGAFGGQSLKTESRHEPLSSHNSFLLTLAQHTNCCMFAFCLIS